MTSSQHDTCDFCVLCGMSPMPVVAELPDGCRAHPGCVSDPVFSEQLRYHEESSCQQ